MIQRREFTSAEFDSLRAHLHSRLQEEGDDKFSTALAAMPPMIQTSVVNVMGFMKPSDYDQFPKTKEVLSSAPKI